jgi:hypothetical protein
MRMVSPGAAAATAAAMLPPASTAAVLPLTSTATAGAGRVWAVASAAAPRASTHRRPERSATGGRVCSPVLPAPSSSSCATALAGTLLPHCETTESRVAGEVRRAPATSECRPHVRVALIRRVACRGV